jgi:uncharacterized protein (DUF1499 family)
MANWRSAAMRGTHVGAVSLRHAGAAHAQDAGDGSIGPVWRSRIGGGILIGVAAIFTLIAVVVLHALLTEGDTVFAGTRPNNLGVKEGRLAPCRRTPNCVSSQAENSDTEHYIDPIAYGGSPAGALDAVRRAVQTIPGARVVREEAGYLYAECRSKWLGFVDDLELAYDESGRLFQVRSASRLGRRDFGVNRARVERLRIALGSPRS